MDTIRYRYYNYYNWIVGETCQDPGNQLEMPCHSNHQTFRQSITCNWPSHNIELMDCGSLGNNMKSQLCDARFITSTAELQCHRLCFADTSCKYCESHDQSRQIAPQYRACHQAGGSTARYNRLLGSHVVRRLRQWSALLTPALASSGLLLRQ